MRARRRILLLNDALRRSQINGSSNNVFMTIYRTVSRSTMRLSYVRVLLLRVRITIQSSVMRSTFQSFRFQALLLRKCRRLYRLLIKIQACVILRMRKSRRSSSNSSSRQTRDLRRESTNDLSNYRLQAFTRVARDRR